MSKFGFLTPLKDQLDRLVAGPKTSGPELQSKLTDVTSADSGVASPPRTPIVDDETTVKDFFNGDEKLPSPPRVDMRMRDVHEQLQTVYPDYERLRDSSDPRDNEKYCKLVYAVGKNFFTRLLKRSQLVQREREMISIAHRTACRIINRSEPEGERFHALFSEYDGDDRRWTLEKNQDSTMPIQEYEDYISSGILSDVADFRENHKADIYEIFNDVDFPNLKPQYRVQNQGNCFAQAPLLLHFYLQLVYNKQLKKEEAHIVNLSRFMRNFYMGEELRNYIMFDEGSTFESVLNKVLDGDYNVPEDFGDVSFDNYVSKLKACGPAIVKMFVGDDFHIDDQYKYEGTPRRRSDNIDGHAMLLVGVMRVGKDEQIVDGTDLYFILQNFWQKKQFLLVRRDYFRECSVPEEGGTASVNFVVYNGCFKSSDNEAIYAAKATHDVALSSHLLECPTSAKTMVRLRSTDSEGHIHTRWV